MDIRGLSIESGVSAEKLNAYIYHSEGVSLWDAKSVARALNVDINDIYDS